MANYEDIIQHYMQEGWLTIPSYYNTEGKEPRCKICGYENNHNGERECHGCWSIKFREEKAKKTIMGLSVKEIKLSDWQIFQVIARQILNGETPYTTPEEFAIACKAHMEEQRDLWQTKKVEQQRIDEILHSS